MLNFLNHPILYLIYITVVYPIACITYLIPEDIYDTIIAGELFNLFDT